LDIYLGIEIGGTKLQIVCGEGDGRITRRWRATINPAAGGTAIRQQIRAGLCEIRTDIKPLAIGVGFGGPIDWRTGRIARSHQIEGWDNFELKPWLERETGLPVATENDANAAALAEATLGAGADADPFFYFNMGSGVGGGIVIGGNIHHGLPPGEGEFGHLLLDRTGTTVESRCSGWAIDRRIRDLAAEHPDSAIARLISARAGGEARHLYTALAQEDAVAKTILAGLSDDLAFALSHVVHLIHPAAIVMGGGLSLIGEPLRIAVNAALAKYVMQAFHPVPPVRMTALGEDAVPVGALVLAGKLVR
jgi:glucokinase